MDLKQILTNFQLTQRAHISPIVGDTYVLTSHDMERGINIILVIFVQQSQTFDDVRFSQLQSTKL